jgi:3-oxoadipate enol-lactonase
MLQTVRDTQLWVQDRGQGEILAFSHGLLMSAELFAPQVEALSDRYRCISWDHRGQGRSGEVQGDEVSIETCTEDAVALLEALGEPVHFVGLSMGGFVGMRVAARRPDLIKSLVLLDTASDPEPMANRKKYERLIVALRIFGLQDFLVKQVLPILCGQSVMTDPALAGHRRHVERFVRSNRTDIYKAVNGVIRREACTHELAKIACPTTVMMGDEDVAISRERAQIMARAIEGSRWVPIPRAGHSASIENPEAVTAALREHLSA